MIRIIHCADVRFDASLGLPDASKAAIRREEMRNTFSSLMTYIRENSVNIALFSGNLFDRNNIGRTTLRFIMDSFESCPDCKFVIAPGEADFYSEDGVYNTVKFPSNVSIFKSTELSSFDFDFDGEKVKVYGHGCTESAPLDCPADKLKAERKSSVINILLSPSDLEDIPEKVNALVSTGVDFAALKGRSAKARLCDEVDMWYAYPGTLEMTSFEDSDEGGFVLIEAEKPNGEFICRPNLIKLMKKRYVTKKLNVSGASKESDVTSAVKKLFDTDKSLNENTLLRLVFTGDVLPTFKLPVNEICGLAKEKALFHFEIVDETIPLYNHEYLSDDPTIKGALFTAFRPQMCSDDREVRGKAIGAFRIGMDALEGVLNQEVTDDAEG